MSVFISYAQDDRTRIPHVIDELRRRGIVDESDKIVDLSSMITVGSTFADMIKKEIETSTKVVVVWSNAGAMSDWVNYEAGFADALGKPILVVIPKGGKSQLPIALAGKQLIELEHLQ